MFAEVSAEGPNTSAKSFAGLFGRTLGIRERLLGSVALLAACLLIVSLVGFISFERMTEKAETIVADRVKPLDQLKIISDRYAVDIVDTTHKTRARTIGWDEARGRVTSAKRDIDTQLEAYLGTYLTTEEQQLAAQARSRMAVADDAVQKLDRLLAARNEAGLVRFAEKVMYPAIDPLTATIGELINLQVRVANDELEAAKALKRRFLLIMLATIALCSGVVAFALYTISRRVIAPIRSMTKAMSRLSRDELDFELPEAKHSDETGTMARALEIFRQTALEKRRFDTERTSLLEREQAARLEQERLVQREQDNRDQLERAAAVEQLIVAFQAEVSATLKSVDKAAQDFQGTARSLREAAHLSTKQAAEVTAGAAVAATNVHTVAAATQELSLSIEEINRNINTSEEVAERAYRHAEQADRITQALTGDATRIGAIIELIKEIAGQTNLLALNATIEAARAGEAGLSFAVVANEIKALAARSGHASSEIEQLVRSIQSTSADTAEIMTSIQAVIEQTRQTSTHIATSIEQQAGATDEISLSSSRAAGAAEQVSAAIADVSDAARNTATMAIQMVSSANELSKQSSDLRSCIESFTLKLRAA